eukprot:s218_g27.t1
MQEIEALCEGWHPLFSKEDIVVLDGSDGCPDYRMRFDSTEGCGTFFRNPAQDDFMALIMGSIEQPDSMEKGLDFYDDKQDVQIHEGVYQVFKHYTKMSSQPRTIALRDFYQGWAAAGSSRGGKPFFLGRMDPAEHCIFFDDHITPLDPKIDPVDAHLWPRRFSSAQLFGVHLVQAQPLLSIRDRDYFVKCFEECEAARAAKLERWHKLKRIVADLDGVRKVLSGFLYTSAQAAMAERAAAPAPANDPLSGSMVLALGNFGGRAAGQGAPGQNDQISLFCRASGVDQRAEISLRGLPVHLAAEIMAQGPILGVNSSAVLMARIHKAEQMSRTRNLSLGNTAAVQAAHASGAAPSCRWFHSLLMKAIARLCGLIGLLPTALTIRDDLKEKSLEIKEPRHCQTQGTGLE